MIKWYIRFAVVTERGVFVQNNILAPYLQEIGSLRGLAIVPQQRAMQFEEVSAFHRKEPQRKSQYALLQDCLDRDSTWKGNSWAYR